MKYHEWESVRLAPSLADNSPSLPITKLARKPFPSALFRLLFLLLLLRRPAPVMALFRAAPPMRRAPKASIMKNWPSIQTPHLKTGGTAIFAPGFVTFYFKFRLYDHSAKIAVSRPTDTCSVGSAGRSGRCPDRGLLKRPRRPLPRTRAVSPSSEVRPSLTIEIFH